MSTNKILTNRYLIAGAVVLVIMASCSKNFLSKYPNDSTSSGEALGTVSALQTAVNGAYSELRQINLYGRDLPVLGDLQADNTFVEQNNSGRYLNQFKYLYTSSDGPMLMQPSSIATMSLTPPSREPMPSRPRLMPFVP